MTDLSPLVFFVKTLFLVSLKIGRVENKAILHSGADKRPLPSNAPPKQAATLEQKRSLQAL